MKISVGDIFVIETTKGGVLLHYIQKDETNGELIRVLSGFHKNIPDDLEKLILEKEQFLVHFPLFTAFKRKIINKVGFFSADNFLKPEMMRAEHSIKGEFLGWHIINIETWQRKLVKNLNSSQKKLSPWGIWNDTLLIKKLEEGWTLDGWD